MEEAQKDERKENRGDRSFIQRDVYAQYCGYNTKMEANRSSFYQKRYGPEILEFVENEIGRIEKNAKELKEDIKYRIPIEHKLVLTKSAKDADITLSSGVGGKTFGLIEVPKDIT